MIPGQFDYARPASVPEVLRLLREREGEAKVLSGGYSLLPLLKLRLAQPALLVDLRDVGGLDGLGEDDRVEVRVGTPIHHEGGVLRIGARVTHAHLETNDLVARRYPLIAETAHGIGDRQVRNWGTIGGSIAHADPSADWPAVLIATHASIVCRNLEKERVVPARDWFLGVFTTALEPDELVIEIRVPRPPAGSGSSYQKLERRAGDFATVGVAAQLGLDGSGRVASAGIGITAVADAPVAATDAEAELVGHMPDEGRIRAAAAAAAAQASPTTDSHGPAEYKRSMTAEMTVRALATAVARASGANGPATGNGSAPASGSPTVS